MGSMVIVSGWCPKRSKHGLFEWQVKSFSDRGDSTLPATRSFHSTGSQTRSCIAFHFHSALSLLGTMLLMMACMCALEWTATLQRSTLSVNFFPLFWMILCFNLIIGF